MQLRTSINSDISHNIFKNFNGLNQGTEKNRFVAYCSHGSNADKVDLRKLVAYGIGRGNVISLRLH